MLNEDYVRHVKDFELKWNHAIYKEIQKLAKEFDKAFIANQPTELYALIEKAKKIDSKQLNHASQMQLHYDIANGCFNLRSLAVETNLEKEIYHFRKTLDIYEEHFPNDDRQESFIAKYIAMRTYTNIANAMRENGRYIAAINYYQEALSIDGGFAMASLNYSIALFQYAPFQLQPFEQQYFHHECYQKYLLTEHCKINLEEPRYLKELEEESIKLFHTDYIEGYLSKPLKLPKLSVESQEEKNYRLAVLAHKLFLEPCRDILDAPCFAVDSLTLPITPGKNLVDDSFIGLFNQIKQEYIAARYLWYLAAVKKTTNEPFFDKWVDLVDVGDSAQHDIRESMLRQSFRSAYSILDRVGFFINRYFDVGIPDDNVNFKNVWKTELRDRDGKVYFEVPHPILSAHEKNRFIHSMFWLQKDVYEDKKTNVTSPGAYFMFQMRNDMEHKCLRTVASPVPDRVDFTAYTSEHQIEQNTLKLLFMLRELIIYLCYAVNIDLHANGENNSV